MTWVIRMLRAAKSWAYARYRSFWQAKLDGLAGLSDDAHENYTERTRIRLLEMRAAARRPLKPEKWVKR